MENVETVFQRMMVDNSVSKQVQNDLGTLLNIKNDRSKYDHFQALMLMMRLKKSLPKHIMVLIEKYFEKVSPQSLNMIVIPSRADHVQVYISELYSRDPTHLGVIPRQQAMLEWPYLKTSNFTRVVRMRPSHFMLYSVVFNQEYMDTDSVHDVYFSFYQLVNDGGQMKLEVYNFHGDDAEANHPFTLGKYSFKEDFMGKNFMAVSFKFYESTQLLMFCVTATKLPRIVGLSIHKVHPKVVNNRLKFVSEKISSVLLPDYTSNFEEDGKHCIEMMDNENLLIASVNVGPHLERTNNMHYYVVNLNTKHIFRFYHHFTEYNYTVENMYGYVFQGILIMVFSGQVFSQYIGKTQIMMVQMGSTDEVDFHLLEDLYHRIGNRVPLFFEVNSSILGISFGNYLYFFRIDSKKGIVYRSDIEGIIDHPNPGAPTVFV